MGQAAWGIRSSSFSFVTCRARHGGEWNGHGLLVFFSRMLLMCPLALNIHVPKGRLVVSGLKSDLFYTAVHHHAPFKVRSIEVDSLARNIDGYCHVWTLPNMQG